MFASIFRKAQLICFAIPTILFAAIPEGQIILPLTAPEMEQFIEQSKQNVICRIEEFPSEQSAQTALQHWNQIGEDLVSAFGTLLFLTQIDSCKYNAFMAIQDLQGFLKESLFQNPEVYGYLISSFNKNLDDLSAFEWYEVQTVIDNAKNIKEHLTEVEQKCLEHLKASNAENENQPFIYLKGSAPDKITTNEALTIFSLNACCMPERISYLFGGVAPWKYRIDPLVDKILATNADIVCLQEIVVKEAGLALYDKLKQDYGYFYMAMGPRTLGFSVDTIGFPSGLFVASKYPIEKAQFTPFTVTGFPMNYGCFDFIVINGASSMGHIYTTHLQSLELEGFSQIRALELQEIIDKMQTDSQSEQKMPYYLCGDFNIPRDSLEPGELLMKANFYDAYNQNPQPINESNHTCTEFFCNYLLSLRKILSK